MLSAEKIKEIINSVYGRKSCKREETNNMSVMKFKVGDKVKVTLAGLIDGERYNGVLYRSWCMDEYKNEIATITDLDAGGWIRIDLDGGLYLWSAPMFEPLAFTKADLKDGMVVEIRAGDRFVVMGDKLPGLDEFMRLNEYTDDLLTAGRRTATYANFDIVKIYQSHSNILSEWFDDEWLTLIWERKEEPKYAEMTVEEIEKKLGYKIKVVGNDA